VHCGSGFWGGQRPSLAGYVMGTRTPRGRPLPEGPSVGYLFLTGAAIALAPMRAPSTRRSIRRTRLRKCVRWASCSPGAVPENAWLRCVRPGTWRART
jgi:hypothetical protein